MRASVLAFCLAALLAAAVSDRAVAREEVGLDPLTVSASPAAGALPAALRSVSGIDRAEIEKWPGASLAELLSGMSGIDVRRRAEPGIQADIGIRGSSFEQTVILLDGMPMADPQTGHHNLNLPVPLASIERIEIVKGPGGMAYGGSATGGVINIVTRRDGQADAELQIRSGSHASRSGSFSAVRPMGRSQHRLGVDYLDSDGHLPENRADARLQRALYSGGMDLTGSALRWGLGAEEREFGAWMFYTADFPDQRERTQSRSAWIGADTRAAGWSIEPQAWWREHDDWFRTMVGDSAYINRHATRVAGLRLSARRDWGRGVTAVGTSLLDEKIDSNALAEHQRKAFQAWLVHRQRLNQRTTLEAGLGLAHYQNQSSHALPSLALSHDLAGNWTAFASAARSARTPSYTELFMDTSGNRGRSELQPERSSYAELGLRWQSGDYRLGLSLYERRTDDLIDWARAAGEVQWQADHFDGHRSRGGEIEWRWLPFGLALERVDLGLNVLETRLNDRGLEIKYAHDHPRWALNAAATWRLGPALRLSTRARYQDRSSGQSGTLIDLRLAWRREHAELFIETNNLLDRHLIEAGFAPLPGRWFYAGLRLMR